jgi:hypothetical protein
VAVPDFAALLERDGDLWKMDIPVWRPVWFGVVGSQLAGSTDKAVLERLAKGETNGFASKPGSPLSGLLGGEGPALVYLQDITPIFWLFLARGESSYAELDAPEGASPEWLEKKKALDAAQQTARVTRKAANDREMEMVLGILEPMGALAFIVRAQEPGLVVDGGQFTKAESIPDLLVKVGSVYRSSRAAVDATHDAARMARENAWKLEDELRRPAEAQVPQVPQVAPPPIEPPTE